MLRLALLFTAIAVPAFAQDGSAPLEWKEQLVKLAIGAALSALSIAATFALSSLRKWADAKGEESKIAKALAVLPHMAEAVYAEVHAEVVDDIELAAADGKITAEELEHIRDVTVQALKDALKKHGLETLKEAFGPALDAVLNKVVGEAQSRAQAASASPK